MFPVPINMEKFDFRPSEIWGLLFVLIFYKCVIFWLGVRFYKYGKVLLLPATSLTLFLNPSLAGPQTPPCQSDPNLHAPIHQQLRRTT